MLRPEKSSGVASEIDRGSQPERKMHYHFNFLDDLKTYIHRTFAIVKIGFSYLDSATPYFHRSSDLVHQEYDTSSLRLVVCQSNCDG
jgi:hypothetical protein